MVLTSIPGKSFFILSISAFTLRATCTELAVLSFLTLRSMEFLPLAVITVVVSLKVSSISATSLNIITPPAGRAMGISPISSTLWNSPVVLSIYLLFPSSTLPPGRLRFSSLKAWTIWASVSP